MTALQDRLGSRSITTVICIDDENAPRTIENEEQALDGMVAQSPRRLKTLAKKDPRFQALAELREKLKDKEIGERRAELEPLLKQTIEEQKLGGADFALAAEILFQGLKGETVERLGRAFMAGLKPMSFKQWRDEGAAIIAAASPDRRLLILVDEVNDKEVDVDLNGTKVLADLWKTHQANLPNIDVIVLTSNCAPQGEFEEAIRLLNDVRDLIEDPALAQQVSRTFVISKERLDNEAVDQQFLIHMDRIEAGALRSELIGLVNAELKAAIANSVSWLEQIPLSEFQGSVFASSEGEGAAEIDTLLRLATVKQRLAMEQLARRDGPLREVVEKLRKFSLKKLDAEHVKAAQPELTKLRRLEFERSAEHINGFRSPIASGDVFELRTPNFEKVAILLANPCDLSLRSEGDRKLFRAWFVELQKGTYQQLTEQERQKGIKAPLGFMLSTGRAPDDIAYLFNNSSVESVDLAVLDLCWLNTDGVARFVPGEARAAYDAVLPPQRARLASMLERVNNGRYRQFEMWGTDFPCVQAEVPNVEIAGAQVNKSVTFGVRRVFRLAPEFAAAVLVTLTHSLSRPAFGHDFRRMPD
jgi:hypothetical protein